MNAGLIILLVLGGLIALFFIIPLFLKKEYKIYRDITINKPKQEVFNYIRFLRNQEQYNKWVMADPHMKKEFLGVDGAPGFVYKWNGNKKVGEGEQEITKISGEERIDMEIRFVRPFKNVAQTPMLLHSLGSDKTQVTWGMEGRNKYPMNLMTLMIDGMLGKDMEESLENLKRILEKN